MTMETVIHDVDEILVGLSDAIEEKRHESEEKMKRKNRINSEKAHRNHLFMTILTGGSIVAVLGVLYCLIINLKEENQHNFLAQFMKKDDSKKNQGFSLTQFNDTKNK